MLLHRSIVYFSLYKVQEKQRFSSRCFKEKNKNHFFQSRNVHKRIKTALGRAGSED